MNRYMLTIAATLITSLATADEGALEINQACAVNGGCFSGDSTGFLVTISGPGSYVLTSNLNVPEDASGIFLIRMLAT